MTTENPHALQLVQRELPTRLGDQARLAAAVEVLADALGARRTEVREALRTSLQAAAADEGTDGATRKLSGLGSLTLTAPEPHAKVTDPQALGAWLAEGHPLGDELVPAGHTAVEPSTPRSLARLRTQAARLIDGSEDEATTVERLAARGLQLAQAALDELLPTDLWLLPEKAAELIEQHPDTQLVPPSRQPAEDGAGDTLLPGYVLHTPSGERVPGCTVTLAEPQVTVRIDPKVRKAEVARLREELGW